MKFSRGDTIWRELRHHLPFTLVVSLLAGVLVAIVYNFWMIPSESFFEVLHPAHVLVSAAATSAIFYRYKKSWVGGMLAGIFGAILVGSVSDVLLPWAAGNLFFLHTHFHLPIVEESFLILGVAIVGAFFGICCGMFRLNHSLHVFFSVFASLFYLLAFSVVMNAWSILGISLIVFLCVYVPCCFSDIIFPLIFIREPCADCGHWH